MAASGLSEPAIESTPAPSLSTRALTIRFGGHVAVNAVTAGFYPATLTVIVGLNGAGKTTYFNVMSGQLPATAGSVHLNGVDITGLGAAHRTRLGIGRAFQLTNLFPNLTVLENVRLAVQSHARLGMNMFGIWFGHKELIERAGHYLEPVALAPRRDARVAALLHGDKRKLEVAILLALEPAVMMFDEPTAGMSVDEVPVVLELIHQVKAERNRTILLVEHKMAVVRALADCIIVLHNGALVADDNPADVMVEALGYRIRRLFVAVFAAGSALAGLGGMMWGLYKETLTASMGSDIMVTVFIVIIIVIIGGPGSVGGCFIGALLMALVTNYVGFLAPKVALVSHILLMIGVLMWRPAGLFSNARR